MGSSASASSSSPIPQYPLFFDLNVQLKDLPLLQIPAYLRDNVSKFSPAQHQASHAYLSSINIDSFQDGGSNYSSTLAKTEALRAQKKAIIDGGLQSATPLDRARLFQLSLETLQQLSARTPAVAVEQAEASASKKPSCNDRLVAMASSAVKMSQTVYSAFASYIAEPKTTAKAKLSQFSAWTFQKCKDGRSYIDTQASTSQLASYTKNTIDTIEQGYEFVQNTRKAPEGDMETKLRATTDALVDLSKKIETAKKTPLTLTELLKIRKELSELLQDNHKRMEFYIARLDEANVNMASLHSRDSEYKDVCFQERTIASKRVGTRCALEEKYKGLLKEVDALLQKIEEDKDGSAKALFNHIGRAAAERTVELAKRVINKTSPHTVATFAMGVATAYLMRS